MSLESDLYAKLSTFAGLTALVSTRIYPNRLPDNPTLPAVVYQRVSTLNNLASGDVPLVRARMQIDCWSPSYVTAGNVADQIHAALDMASSSGLEASIPEDQDDTYDFEAQLHRKRIDFFIWRNQ